MLSYDKLFSRVLNKINDPKELSLDESDLLEIYTERLHSVIGKPRVRRLFSSITLDDEIQEIVSNDAFLLSLLGNEDSKIRPFATSKKSVKNQPAKINGALAEGSLYMRIR